MDFEIGQRVADYEIVNLIGVGGMGRVYRVRNIISHRTEAMKVLLSDLNADPELAARFLSEIRTLATLDHPHIAQLHTAMQTGNELVMMMEFVDGSTLQQLAQQAPISPRKIVDYMHQVLSALSFAHSRGVIHRDIKPANIMVTPTGMVKLTDFGIAKSKVEDELTRPGTTVGSLNYMSPEQALGGVAIDGRADLYSLGITMYELLAGRRPFEDESAYVVLHRQLNAEPIPPVEVNPLLSQPLSDLILKALEKDPLKRFQDAAAFSHALREVTGIAASTPVRNYTSFTSSRLRIPAAAATVQTRVSTAASRRVKIAAEAGAVACVVALAAFAVPHLIPHLVSLPGSTNTVAQTITRPASVSTTAVDQTAPLSAATKPTNSSAAVIPDLSAEPSPVVAPAPQVEGAAYQLTPITPKTSTSLSNPVLDHSKSTLASANSLGASASLRSAEPKRTRVDLKMASLRSETSPAEEGARELPRASVATSAELQQLRDQTRVLDARAATLRSSVEHMKNQQEAAGDGLNQDVADAYVRMNAYLNAEKTDLEDGNAVAARDYLEKVKSEENTLGKLLNP
jgi:eukaryotic-like serine/threonine-protein kinase